MAVTPDWIAVVKDVGVPIAMLAWFAVRFEGRIEKLNDLLSLKLDAIKDRFELVTKALTELTRSVDGVDDKIDSTGKHMLPRKD